MTDLPRTGRRRLLAMLTTLPAAMRAGALFAASPPASGHQHRSPKGPRLLVAGPSDGALNRWADALLPALEQSLPPDTSIRRVEVGSADGVTGANQFEARGAPDGHDGAAGARPGGDCLDGRRSAGAVRRRPLGAGAWPATRRRHRRRSAERAGPGRACPRRGRRTCELRPACDARRATSGRDPWNRYSAWPNQAAARSAFAQGAVDAVLLRGHGVPEQFAAFAAAGAQPLFALGAIDAAGEAVRDPDFPEVPHFAELFAARTGNKPRGALFEAWSAAAAAAQLEFGLVLPQLTPAAMVSLWRRAGADAMAVAGRPDRRRHRQCAAARRARGNRHHRCSSPWARPPLPSCGAGWPAGSTGIRPDAPGGLA